jgi:hypothetical protein
MISAQMPSAFVARKNRFPLFRIMLRGVPALGISTSDAYACQHAMVVFLRVRELTGEKFNRVFGRLPRQIAMAAFRAGKAI